MNEKKSESTHCKNYEKEFIGKYCSNCGQPKELKRINRQYITDEVSSVLNFDKGIFYTIKEVLIRPGKTIRHFILEDRNKLVKPIVFVLISSLIYTIFLQLFNFEDGYVNYSSDDSTATIIFNWISRNYGYANFLMAIFIALWIKIFFRKHGYNFFEILILLCFVIGVGMLLFTLFGTIDSLVNLKIADKGFLIGVLYIIWATGSFFSEK